MPEVTKLNENSHPERENAKMRENISNFISMNKRNLIRR